MVKALLGDTLTLGHRSNDGKTVHETEVPQFGLGVFLMKEKGECRNSCQWALNSGYRHIDTAAVYENEAEVGQALQETSLLRTDIFVTTKLRRGDALGYDAAIAAFEASLARLKLDYVDLYLVHAPPEDIECRGDVWRAMEDILESGRSRAIGVSNYGAHHLQELMVNAKYGPAVNQIEIHPWLQRQELRAATAAIGAVPMAYSPLARGHKVNDRGLAEIATRLGCTPAQVAIKWCYDQGCITIPKSSNEGRIIENIASLDVNLEDDAEALADLDEGYISGWDPTSQP